MATLSPKGGTTVLTIERHCDTCTCKPKKPMPVGCVCNPDEWTSSQVTEICEEFTSDVYPYEECCVHCYHEDGCHGTVQKEETYPDLDEFQTITMKMPMVLDLIAAARKGIEGEVKHPSALPTHESIFEYDGAFRCYRCYAWWGALPGHPTAPDLCIPCVQQEAPSAAQHDAAKEG